MADVAEFREVRLVDKHQSWTLGGPLVSRLPEPEIEHLEGRASATMGEPGTLGWFGFATGTWMTGVVLGGFVASTTAVALAPVLTLFAGVALFVAGLYSFRRVNTLAASAFCCYGAYNAVVGVMLLFGAAGLMPTTGAGMYDVMAWLNFSFAFISLAFLLASLRRNLVMPVIMACLACGYTLTGIGALGVGPTGSIGGGVSIAGGILLFIAAFFMYYMGTALVANSGWNRRILPLAGEA